MSLADLFDDLPSDRIAFIGDFNCPGATEDAVDCRRDALLSCFSYTILNDGLTLFISNGGQSKLDANRRLSNVTTTSVGFSDHRLIRAHFCCRRQL